MSASLFKKEISYLLVGQKFLTERAVDNRNNIPTIDMVTGQQYNVEAGDRLSLPKGTIYSTLTHQGATYYWCSKKAEEDEHGKGEWPGQKDEVDEEECPW